MYRISFSPAAVLLVWAGLWLVGAAPGVAQGLLVPSAGDRTGERSVQDSLRSLSLRAGVVFAGQVTRIERHGGFVQIIFHVDQQVSGQAGETFELREWAGLWTGGQQRYVLGQRAMVFLNPVNPGGLSSPVDGMEGVIPVVPQGADRPALLDLRRLSTRTLRQPGEPLVNAGMVAMALPQAAAAVSAWRHGTEPSQPVVLQLPASGPPEKNAQPQVAYVTR